MKKLISAVVLMASISFGAVVGIVDGDTTIIPNGASVAYVDSKVGTVTNPVEQAVTTNTATVPSSAAVYSGYVPNKGGTATNLTVISGLTITNLNNDEVGMYIGNWPSTKYFGVWGVGTSNVLQLSPSYQGGLSPGRGAYIQMFGSTYGSSEQAGDIYIGAAKGVSGATIKFELDNLWRFYFESDRTVSPTNHYFNMGSNDIKYVRSLMVSNINLGTIGDVETSIGTKAIKTQSMRVGLGAPMGASPTTTAQLITTNQFINLWATTNVSLTLRRIQINPSSINWNFYGTITNISIIGAFGSLDTNVSANLTSGINLGLRLGFYSVGTNTFTYYDVTTNLLAMNTWNVGGGNIFETNIKIPSTVFTNSIEYTIDLFSAGTNSTVTSISTNGFWMFGVNADRVITFE